VEGGIAESEDGRSGANKAECRSGTGELIVRLADEGMPHPPKKMRIKLTEERQTSGGKPDVYC